MSSETIIKFSLNRHSDDLELGNALEASWSLQLSWKKDGRPKSMAVCRTTSSGKVDFEIHLKLTYLNTDGELVSTDKLFVSCLENGQKDTYISLHFPFSGEFEGHIILYEASETVGEYNATTHFKNLPSAFEHLSDNCLVMFNNDDFFPDVTLVCGNKKFLGHKAILSARSPVFGRMFRTEMLEIQGVVNVVDIEPNVLEFTLKYIYSGKTDPLTDELAEDLLFASNKYMLPELKAICVRKLKLNTTVDNVSRLLALGFLYDDSLLVHAKNFVNEYDNFSEIEDTQGWRMLEETNKDLAHEVVKMALKNRRK